MHAMPTCLGIHVALWQPFPGHVQDIRCKAVYFPRQCHLKGLHSSWVSFMQHIDCCTHCRIALCTSRCEAFYRAYQRSPDNALVQRSLKVGFPFCKKLRYRTPLDVLKWYKQFQNSFAGPITPLLLLLPVLLILFRLLLQLLLLLNKVMEIIRTRHVHLDGVLQ